MNILSVGLLVACCLAAVSGQLLRPHCAATTCLRVTCLGSYVPPGECCPVCPGGGEKPGRCPRTLGTGKRGICAELCTSDFSCPGRQKCCSNGCGHTCQNPVHGGGPGFPDCSIVRCAQPRCPGAITPPGSCCPVCPDGRY